MADERREGRGRNDEGKATVTGETNAESRDRESSGEMGHKSEHGIPEGSLDKGSINAKRSE